jgi:hypothetical protein
MTKSCVPGLALFLGLAWISPAQAQVTYSGRAFAASIDPLLQPPSGVVFADTGPLPPGGGLLTASLPSADVGDLFKATGLAASTSGGNNVAASSASLNSLQLFLSENGAVISASFVSAETQASCDGGATGATEIVDLVVDGSPVDVTGDPNQTVSTSVGVLVINEQTITPQNGGFAITVNALHLVLAGSAGEIVVARTESDIAGCASTVCHDFVTGGGWIPLRTTRGNFGFNAGFKPNASSPTVSFNYIDHDTGMHVKAASITVYVVGSSPTTRHFEGDASIDGVLGTYAVDVSDNGEPGTADTFAMVLSNGYAVGGTLGGGNIQLHGECDSAGAP